VTAHPHRAAQVTPRVTVSPHVSRRWGLRLRDQGAGPRWFGVAAVGAGALCLLHLVWMSLALGGSTATAWFDDLAVLGAALAGATCCAEAARRGSGRCRRAWALMTASALSWAAGQATWCWFELMQGRAVPFPSPADAGFLLAVPPALAAVLLLAGHDRLAWRLRSVLDGLIVAVALLSVSWATVLGAVHRAAGSSMPVTALALTHPVGDVAVGTMLVILVIRAPRRGRLPLILLALGLSAAALADGAVAYGTAATGLGRGGVLDTGWVAAHLLLGLAALRAAAAPLAPVAESPSASPGRRLLPYLPVAIAGVMAVDEEFHGGPLDRVLFAMIVLLVLLVVARELLTVRERPHGTDAARGHRAAASGPGDVGAVRLWLARELHDDALQTLTTMLLDMEQVRREVAETTVSGRVLDFQHSTRSAIGGLRRLLGELRDQSGEDHRLVGDLTDLLGQLDDRAGIKGRISVSPSWPASLSTHIASNLRRIAEEALRNAALHSGAQHVLVTLEAEEERLTLTVSDDGQGCRWAGTASPGGSGLLGMQERALLLGGHLEVRSRPGGGTTVRGTFAPKIA
jgi:signal transduction histidine kinase